MSQLGVTKSFRNTTLSSTVNSWRNESGLRPRVADRSNASRAPQPAWKRQMAEGDSASRSITSIAENDGFTPASHAKSNRPSYNDHDLRAPASQANRGSSYVSRSLNPPSSAAIARSACDPYHRPPGSNRSFVPDPEQDLYRQRREANQFIRIPPEKYKLGMIIRAPLHEQDSALARRPGAGGAGSSVASNASEATKAETYRTESRMGTIFTKQRKMIVVALHTDHYVAIPLYTHNGRGLANKRTPEEFVSVKDHRYTEEFVKLSIHDPLVTEMIKEGINLFDPMSTAHLAYPVSRRYTLPVVHEGHLRNSSLRILVTLYNRYAEVEAR
ncbi:MAG: hypothetical protein Q9213_004955 [Squamulea squamosa]